MTDCIALIVAAGRGQRLGGELPKQYLPLGGRSLLAYSVAAFAAHPRVAGVRVVIHPADRDLYEHAVQGISLLAPVHGGASRQDSVRLGLESLSDRAPARVLIHDAARPFVSAAVIDGVLDGLDASAGAIPALAVTDSLKRGYGGRVTAAVDRSGLWQAQTPQGFLFNDILAAHREAKGSELGDDAEVAERVGLEVALVAGSKENFKVTTPQDMDQASRLLAVEGGETRTGSGFDVHAFGPGDHVMLCGVPIAHSCGLVGHSDADVGLHAATDAVLGAFADGDIGAHFPPSEARWKDAPSEVFLKHAALRLAERGGAIIHLDITLICEQPKIAPYRDAMRLRLAGILGVDVGRVSVKATTTEGLGFPGRGEGIVAQAIATIRLPRATLAAP